MKRMKLLGLVLFLTLQTFAQSTSFTYQGSLKTGGIDANGSHDFEFVLFNAESGGSQLGSTVTQSGVTVTNGIFSVSLDFGNQFPGASRFLEIRVRQTGGGAYTTLTPRQPVASTPYAIKSTNSDAATTATNSTQLGGVAAAQFVQTADPRLSDARPPTAGSSNYIQNTSSLQALSNFNVSGTGTANIVSAVNEYRIGTFRVLSTLGTNNLFAGMLAGASNTTGSGNTFIGRQAGELNVFGPNNTFVGFRAGRVSGGSNDPFVISENSFFGSSAGELIATGTFNSFFGANSGSSLTGGFGNSFFGYDAGGAHINGNSNSYFGYLAGSTGIGNTSGTGNVIIGSEAGSNNQGNHNVFVGRYAGTVNTTGSNNTTIGQDSDVGSGTLTYGTAIGAGAVVNSSNRIQLGRQDGSDDVRVSGNLLLATLGTAGTTTLCRNIFQQVATCSSSLRYKTNLNPFGAGLSLINQLKPITFDWKDGGMRDLGLGAEEVAAIEPLLVTYNSKGEVEGVKYDRIGVVLVNAVKEQQTQISDLKAEVAALRAIVCSIDTKAEVCKK